MAVIGKGVFIPPTSEDNRLFATEAAANVYIASAAAKAGQSIKIYDESTGKYKGYILQTENDTLVKRPSGSSAVVAEQLPTVADGDPDMDYYIGSAANGYTHYRLIGSAYVPVGGDTASIEAAIASINAALAGKGAKLDINSDTNSLMLLDINNNVLGQPVVLPQTGITGITAYTEKVTTAQGDKWYLVMRDPSNVELTRCEIPAAGGKTDSYSVRLYNRTGGAMNFTAPAATTVKVKVSFHEDNPDGDQTTEPGHIKAYYKAQGAAESAYTLFKEIDIPQDTDTEIDISDYLTVDATTNIKITAHGTPQQETSATGEVIDTTIVRSLVYTVRCVEMAIESLSPEFPSDKLSTSIFTGNTVLNYRTIGNGISKTMHFEVDGNNIVEPYSIGKSHLQSLDFTLPISQWTHGAHNLCYYFVTEDGATSNKLSNIVLYNKDGVTPIIGLDKSTSEITFGEPIVVRYVAYDPDTTKEAVERVEIKLLDSNRKTLKTVVHTDVPLAQQKLEFSPEEYLAAGTFTIRATVDDLVTSTHTVTVNPYQSEYNINPITTNLVYAFNASGHSNSDTDKQQFVYSYGDYNIYATNNNFNWSSNGYVTTITRDKFKTDLNNEPIQHEVTALRISGGATHTIELPIFTSRFTNRDGDTVPIDTAQGATPTDRGRTIEINYNVVAAADDNSTIIQCANTTNEENEQYVGFKVTPLTCALKSTRNQNGSIKNGFITQEEGCAAAYLRKNTNASSDKSLDTEQRVHLTFVVEALNKQGSGNQAINIYVNGKYAKSLPYVANDSFTQNSPIIIGGPDAIVDLYSVRIYNSSLSPDEVAQNYYASQPTIAEREGVAEFNNVLDSNNKVSYDLARKHYYCLKLKGELSPDKPRRRYCGVTLTMASDTQDGYTTLIDLNDLNPDYTPDVSPDAETGYVGRFFCSNKVQGTSSQRFIRKNYKVYLVGSDGKKVKFPLKGYTDGTYVYDKTKAGIARSIPESTLCFKMDYMSSDHANTFNANMIDTMYDDKTKGQLADPRCQVAVYGFRCLLFVEDPDTGVITFAGDGTLNNDKSNFKTFGLEVDGDEGTDTSRQQWDFRNNSTDICMFKTDRLQAPVTIQETTVNPETGEEETVDRVVPAIYNALESIYPDQDDLMEDYGVLPDYDHIQVLYTWVCQRANFWDETNASRRAIKRQIFRNEFTKHFNLHRALTYYCFMDFVAMVDNHAKNIHLRSEDIKDENIVFTGDQTSIADIIDENGVVDVNAIDWDESTFATWLFDPYDLDSCFGAENEGYLYVPYYADWDYSYSNGNETKYAINGHASLFWNMFRDAFNAEIKERYQQMAHNDMLTYDNFKRVHITNGNELISGAVVNRDMEFKYNDAWTIGYYDEDGKFVKTPRYKYLQRGDRGIQKEVFMYKRAQLKYSQFQTDQFRRNAVEFRSDLATGQAYPVVVTASQYIYPAIGLNDKNNPERYDYPTTGITLLAPGESATIGVTMGNSDNLFVYSASNLSKLDISALKPYAINLSSASNLKELILGSEGGEKFSPRGDAATLWSFASSPLLEKLNVGGAENVATLDLTGNANLKELYAGNSSFTTINFPSGGLLTTMHLPSTLTTLEIHNQTQLSDFTLAGYNNLTELIVENTPSVPITDIIISRLNQLQKIRLTNVAIDLGDDENDILHLLLSDDMRGKYVDDAGRGDDTGTKYPYISGVLTVDSIGTNLYNKLSEAYPYLDIQPDTQPYTQYTVEYVVGDETVSTEEADVYNNFSASYNTDGTLPTYPVKESQDILGVTHYYLFDKWVITGEAASSANVDELGNVTNVSSDLVVTATFTDCYMPATPHAIPEGGYLYHSANPELSAYTTGEFYAICKSNVLNTVTTESRAGYFKIGDQIYIQLDDEYSTFSNGHLIFDIIGLRHFRKAIGNGFANIVFACHYVPTTFAWNSRGINTGGWAQSQIRYWLNGIENTHEPWSYVSGTKTNEYYYNDTGTDANGVVTPSNTSTLYQTYSLSMWARIPYQLRIMIESVQVIGNNGNQATDPKAVTITNDKLFLFSYYEVFGSAATNYQIYTAEVDSGAYEQYRTFPFFVNNNAIGYRIKTQEYSTAGQNWWTRTPVTTSGSFVWYTNYYGGAANNFGTANYAYGAVFGFCI